MECVETETHTAQAPLSKTQEGITLDWPSVITEPLNASDNNDEQTGWSNQMSCAHRTASAWMHVKRGDMY